METVSNIFLKSDTSFEINEISQVPIIFNNNVYDYYISLLSFSFLNCSPNITDDQEVNFTITFTDNEQQTYQNIVLNGVYDTDDLINLLNSYFTRQDSDNFTHNYLTFTIDPFTEKTQISFNTSEATLVNVKAVELIMNNKSLLNNDLFRFEETTNLSFNQSNTSYTSNKAFRITTYNNVILTSSSIPGLVSLYGDDNGITTSSALYVISSVAEPYTMIEYTAIQPVDFPIGAVSNLTNYQFKLTDENGNDLKLLPNGTPDFSVKLAIKRKKK